MRRRGEGYEVAERDAPAIRPGLAGPVPWA